jgi:quinol monooxygenase YgiN
MSPTATVTSIFTLIDPDGQEALLALLTRNATDILEHAAGFLGSTLSSTGDGTTVIHHAQWRSARDVKAMLDDPAAQENMAHTRRLATTQIIRATKISEYGAAPT